MPGSVPLVLLLAQQMPDATSGQLHDGRRPRLTVIRVSYVLAPQRDDKKSDSISQAG